MKELYMHFLLLAFILFTTIGCKKNEDIVSSEPLLEILRSSLSDRSEVDSETSEILEVVARFISTEDSRQDSSGKLVELGRTYDQGVETVSAQWQREIVFSLGEALENGKLAMLIREGDMVVKGYIEPHEGTIDREGIIRNIYGAKETLLSKGDPLLQVLTISGYHDEVIVTDEGNGHYVARVSTPSIRLELKGSTLLRARLSQ